MIFNEGEEYDQIGKKAVEKHGIKGGVGVSPDASLQIHATGREGQMEAFSSELTKISLGSDNPIATIAIAQDNFPLSFVWGVERPDIISTFLFLLGPDPLEMLCRRVVGVPDSVP